MSTSRHSIILNNLKKESVVCYSVIILKGDVKNLESSCNLENDTINFLVENGSYKHNSSSKMYSNKFCHLICLKLGLNVIKVQYCCSSAIITINFEPKVREYCVVPVYIVCQNHDGKFQSPAKVDNSIDSACERIALGTKLIQSLFAEKFYEIDLGRKTFQIETDLNPEAPKCRVFYSKLSVDAVRSMRQEELWSSFGRELMTSELGSDKFKYLAFISCTRYCGDKYDESVMTHEDIVRLTEAHVALGGGGMAIFGSACLHTWPSTLEELSKCLEDDTVVDKKELMDDSCYRGTYGGCFATTLGSVCHELCHTFDLGHTTDGIMSRGFDEINREFTLAPLESFKRKSKVFKILSPEKQHCTVDFTPNINVKVVENNPSVNKKNNICSNKTNSSVISNKRFTDEKKTTDNKKGVYWSRNCSLLLFYHRWLNGDTSKSHSLFFDEEKSGVVSSAGISVVELRLEESGLVIKWWDFSSEPVFEFTVPEFASIKTEYKDSPMVLVVEDVVGNILKHAC